MPGLQLLTSHCVISKNLHFLSWPQSQVKHSVPCNSLPGGAVAKDLPKSARDADYILVLGRCPRGGNGNPLHYSCLENPMDRKVWLAIVHGFAKIQT